jgi:hypothetical protein
MEEFVIDRSKWLCGEGAEDSALLRDSDGKMCCIGQYCLLKGLKEHQIDNVQTAETLVNSKKAKVDEVPRWLLEASDRTPQWKPSKLATKMMRVNDDEHIMDSEREAKLIKLFAIADIHVTFVNSVQP